LRVGLNLKKKGHGTRRREMKKEKKPHLGSRTREGLNKRKKAF